MGDIKDEKVVGLRKHVDRIDAILLHALAERLWLMPHLGKYRYKNKLPITDEKREIQMINKYRKFAKEYNLDPDFVEDFFLSVINESKRIMSNVMKDIKKGKIKIN